MPSLKNILGMLSIVLKAFNTPRYDQKNLKNLQKAEHFPANMKVVWL